MDMTNITKIPLRTLLEDLSFEADNDEKTVYELAINIENKHKDKNYSGPLDMLIITLSFDYEFPGNYFESVKDNGVRITYRFIAYDELGKIATNYTDTLYTKDSKEVVKFLERYIGEIKKKGASGASANRK